MPSSSSTGIVRQARLNSNSDFFAVPFELDHVLARIWAVGRALEELAQSHLRDGDTAQAAPVLEQALTIYQRIGTPDARRIQRAFQRHEQTSITPEPQPAAADDEDSQTAHGPGTHQAGSPTE